MTITNASDYTDGRPGRRCRLAYSHITSLTTPPPAQHEAKWRALRTFKAAATYSRRHDGKELSATLTFDGDAAPTFRLTLGPWGGVTCKRIELESAIVACSFKEAARVMQRVGEAA